jgi:hypothetical protein
MRRRINEAVVSGEAWASAMEKAHQYWPHLLWLLSMTGLGTWFATGWNALSGQGWGIYPLVGVAVGLAMAVGFAAFSFGINQLRRKSQSNEPASVEATADARTKQFEALELTTSKPAVEFWLPSNWTPGFRAGNPGGHDEAGHKIASEEMHVRVVAKQRLEDVRFEISVLCRHGDQLEELARIGSDKFSGVVPKDIEQTFVVLRRTYVKVPAALNDKSNVRVRVEKDITLFPDNPARVAGKMGEQYHFHLNVFHGHGSAERAAFSVQLHRKRDFPQSEIISRYNIEPIMGQ